MASSGIQIKHLDHIALRVKDIQRSANWYESVLGLKRVQPEEWKPWPIFMVAGHTGLALFPEKEGPRIAPDHFAFRVGTESFKNAQEILKSRGIAFEWQDHQYFESIYFSDPDGHTVELTVAIRPF